MTLFTKKNCPKCVELKNKLRTMGVEFKEVDVEADNTAVPFLRSHGKRAVPQLFDKGTFIRV